MGTVPGGAGAYAGGAHVLGSVNGDPSRGSLFFVLDSYALDEPQGHPPGPAWSGAYDLATGFERWERYTFTHAATRIDTPAGAGERRSTRILNGYAAGLYEPVVFPGPGESPFVDPVSVANRNDRPEDVVFDFRADRNRLRATFRLKNTGRYDDPRRADDFKPGTDFTDLDVVTGTLHRDESPHRSVFIDDDRFMARDARNPGRYESREHSRIDGETPAHEGTYLVSSGLVPLDGFLPAGAAWCDCRYAKWGWWGGELANRADSAQYRSHLATFVAGTLPGAREIPATGSALVRGPPGRPGHQPGKHVRGRRKLREDLGLRDPDRKRGHLRVRRRGLRGRRVPAPGGATSRAPSRAPPRGSRGGAATSPAPSSGRAPTRPGRPAAGFRIEDPANAYGATGIFLAARATR